jgi:hypothetical protein
VKGSYKVAVWATGGVGKYAIRTIADRVRSHPGLALSPGNFKASHWRCNMRKGGQLDNDDDLDIGIPSEQW